MGVVKINSLMSKTLGYDSDETLKMNFLEKLIFLSPGKGLIDCNKKVQSQGLNEGETQVP